MTEQIIAELKHLRTRVEIARKEWDDYMNSLHSRPLQDTERLNEPSIPTKEPSIATKVKAIDSFTKSLECRLQVLIDLRATNVLTLGSVTALISQRLPAQILGSETANSLLMRTLNAVEEYLEEAQEDIASREHHISEQFDVLRKNYDAVLEVVNVLGRHLEVRIMLQRTRACVEEMLEEEMEVQDVDTLLERLEDGLYQCGDVAGKVEVQVMKYKRNIALVGVRVSRQRLITEFLDA